MKLTHEQFDGIMPKKDSTLLPENAAITAENFDLTRGDLTPYRIASVVTSAGTALADPKSLYKYRSTEGEEWMFWDEEDIDVVSSPVNGDIYERVFILGTDDGKLKQKGLDPCGLRDVFIQEPGDSISTIATTIFDPSNTTCNIEVTTTGTAVLSDSPIYFKDFVENDNGYELKFTYDPNGSSPEIITTTGSFRLDLVITNGTFFVGSGGDFWNSFLDINLPNIQTDSGAQWADIRLTGVSGTISSTLDSTYVGPGIKHLLSDEPVEITVNIVMNWRYPREYYYYLITFVNDLGQEGPPSEVAGVFYRDLNQRITVNGLPSPVGDATITKKRLYRSTSGSDPATAGFQLVTELSSHTSSFIDTVVSGELGVSFAYRKSPEDDMRGLVAHPARFLCAFKDDQVFFTEPYLPHAWNYKKTVDSPVVGLAISGNDVVVLTTGRPTLFSGVNPAAMRETKLMAEYSCTSKRGICNVGHIVSYPSPDGLIFLSGGEARLVTKEFFHHLDWLDWQPEGMIATQHDSKIFAWMNGVNFIFDVSAGLDAATTFTTEADGVFNDLFDDSLYYLLNGYVFQWEGSSSNMTGTWRGRNFNLARPVAFSKFRVIAEGYPVSAVIYVDDVEFKELTIESNKVYNLPVRRADEIWSLEVSGAYPIRRIDIGQSTGDFL